MYQSTHYRTLFELYIRHGYMLDDGDTPFDSLNAINKANALKRYRYEELVSVVPTQRTVATIGNHRLLSRRSNQTFTLVGSTREGSSLPLTGLDDSTVFVFLIRSVHPKFPYFTNLTIESGRMLLLANDQPEEIETSIPLIPVRQDNPPPATPPVHVDDSFLLSEEDTTTMLEAFTDPLERSGVIGMVWIRVKSNSNDDLSLLNTVSGTIKANWPKFLLHFDTQSTFWRYVRETPLEVKIYNTAVVHPITRFGYIELDPATDFEGSPLDPPEANYAFPNPMLEIFEFEGTDVYSVIFI